MKKEKTKVIIRQEQLGEETRLIAFFPELLDSPDRYTCTCFTLQEGHSEAHINYYRDTKKPNLRDPEIKEQHGVLLKTLTDDIGYELEEKNKWTRDMDRKRKSLLSELSADLNLDIFSRTIN